MNLETLKTRLAEIPYVQTIGAEPIMLGGELLLKLNFKPDNIGNPFLPALHGGCIGGFMEMAAITQLVFAGGYDTVPKPIDINIDFIRSGRPEDTFARAEIIRRGVRVANVQVRAWQTSIEEPIALLHGHYITALTET